jgi:hypothetical protein
MFGNRKVWYRDYRASVPTSFYSSLGYKAARSVAGQAANPTNGLGAAAHRTVTFPDRRRCRPVVVIYLETDHRICRVYRSQLQGSQQLKKISYCIPD